MWWNVVKQLHIYDLVIQLYQFLRILAFIVVEAWRCLCYIEKKTKPKLPL